MTLAGWRRVSLGDAIQLQRGFDITRALQRRGSVPVVSSGGVSSHHDEAIAAGPGVVIGRKGTLGKTFYFEGPYWPHDTTLWVSDFKGSHERFVYYLLSGIDFKRFDVGSANPTLNRNHIHPMPIVLPPLGEQCGIACVLGALDDKIESNRRLRTAMDELAAAMAVGALRSATARSVELRDVVHINPVTVRAGELHELLDYIDIASVSPGTVEDVQRLRWGDAPSRARRGVSDGDVIYSTVRPERRAYALLLSPTPETVVSTGFAVLRPTTACGSSLLTTIAGSREFAGYLRSVAQGSAYPAVHPRTLGRFRALVPGPAEARAFEMRTMPLRRRAAHAFRESRRLAELRDALLPELLSGRIRVPEASEAVDHVLT